MKTLLTFCLMLTCATLHAQTVIVKGTGAGAVHRSGTGAGSVRGVAKTETTYSSGRFSVWSDNTNVVVDNDSSLTWTRNANIGGIMTWSNAVAYCSNLTHAGYGSGWRLPSMVELSRDASEGATNGLLSSGSPTLPTGHPFTNMATVGSLYYWSSTTHTEFTDYAWLADLDDGDAAYAEKAFTHYVWPCRGP